MPFLVVACTATAPDFPTPKQSEQLVVDEAVGVALALPDNWHITKDPVLFGLWSSSKEPMDARGADILQRLTFHAPSMRVDQVPLVPARDALYGSPPDDIAPSVELARLDRATRYQNVIDLDPMLRAAAETETHEAPQRDPNSCGFTAPSSLYWQTQVGCEQHVLQRLLVQPAQPARSKY